MDPLSPETRWQLIVLHILTSGELFSYSAENEDKLFHCFMWRAGNTFTFSFFPDSFAYMFIFSVSLPMGNWAVCFVVYFSSCNDVEN